METMSLDIETFSDIDLIKCGIYRYTESPLFDILLLSYSVGGSPVRLIDLACGEKLPSELIHDIMNDQVIKTAYNANFERIAIMRYLSRILNQQVVLNPSSWNCTAVQAGMLGLPLYLDGVAKVLRLEQQKMAEGKALIRYFCIPCKAAAANGGRTRNLPSDSRKSVV